MRYWLSSGAGSADPGPSVVRGVPRLDDCPRGFPRARRAPRRRSDGVSRRSGFPLAAAAHPSRADRHAGRSALTTFTNGWAVGWASTPYDPVWASNYPRRAATMAAAGPGGNLLIAMLAFGAIRG